MSIKGNKRVIEYLNNVCIIIKNKKVHKNIKAELISHIEEIAEDYTSINYTEEQAIEKALEQLGSYEVIGNELNKVHKIAPDWILLAMTGIFMLIGITLLGYIERSYSVDLLPYNFVAKTIICSIIGVVFVFILLKIDYRMLEKYSKIIYISSLLLMMYSLFFTNYINGVRGYIVFGSIAFNAFNVAAFLLVISIAGILKKYDWESKKKILIGLGILFTPCIFFALGASLASVSTYLIGAFTVALISGLKLRHFFIATSALFTIGVFGVFIEPYRVSRLFAFLTPYSDAEGAGWIYNTLAQLRNQGGLFGAQKAFNPEMLPDFYSDFMLTFIMYSFGWIITLILIALVLAFIFRIGFIGAKTKEAYGKLLICGLCGYFATQFGFNILMNFTLSPTLAIGMPFISYGGTGLIINFVTIGIITSVYKWRNSPLDCGKAIN